MFSIIFCLSQVSSYGDKIVMNSAGGSNEEGSTLSAFRALAAMLSSLTNSDGDGRIIISRARLTSSGEQGGYLKYVMLTGEKIFSEVLCEAENFNILLDREISILIRYLCT